MKGVTEYTLDVYRCPVIIVTNTDMEKVYKWLDRRFGERFTRYGDKPSTGQCSHYPLNNGAHVCVIWLFHKDPVTIAHGTVHAAYMILDYVGVQHDLHNHEALAYLQSHLMEVCLDTVRKQQRKKRKKEKGKK